MPSLDNYITNSDIQQLEVNGHVYIGQTEVENAINKALEKSMSHIFKLDYESCEKLFSFQVPQISASMDEEVNREITMTELRKALNQLNSNAAPGVDGIPSNLYVKMIDLFAPIMLEVFNYIVKGGGKPPETMRTSTV